MIEAGDELESARPVAEFQPAANRIARRLEAGAGSANLSLSFGFRGGSDFEEITGGGAFHHAGNEPVDAGGRAARSLPRRLLHARQTGVDSLDRSVCVVDVHLDDEFGLIVGGPCWVGVTIESWREQPTTHVSGAMGDSPSLPCPRLEES